MACAQDENLGPPMERTLRLLLSSYTEDVPQQMVHPVHPIDGGHGQSVQKHHCRGHVLAGPSKGWMWHPLVVDGGSEGPGPSSGFGEVDACGLHHP
jgi:hypothetical protein